MEEGPRRRLWPILKPPAFWRKSKTARFDLAHSDRSKTPIEPYLAYLWFVKMDELAQTAMDAVTGGKVKIMPERYAKGYLDWLGEKRDWPIGRQLVVGTSGALFGQAGIKWDIYPGDTQAIARRDFDKAMLSFAGATSTRSTIW